MCANRKPSALMSFKSAMVLAILVILFLSRPLLAAAVPVRFAEGLVHGFLVLREVNGAMIASGDLLQVAKGGGIESQLRFRFKDGSLYDERVSYTQERVFAMQIYRLLQQGPVFSDDTEISMERSGKYRVKTKTHKSGREEVLEGTLDLPPDVYNGMVITVVKNLPQGVGETVHFVAFTPAPRLIQLELLPGVEEKVQVGEITRSATQYVFKPQLGIWLKLFATLLGRLPPDYHAWVIKEELPAFLRADGPLYTGGPIWRMELSGPRWPK